MSNATELTGANFDSTVATGVTLVDFWAQWCQPCLMMAPALDELSAEFECKATIGKVNVDNEGELAQKFGVSAIPTLVVLKGFGLLTAESVPLFVWGWFAGNTIAGVVFNFILMKALSPVVIRSRAFVKQWFA